MGALKSTPPPPYDPHPKSGPIDLSALRPKVVSRPNVERLTARNGTRDWFASWCARRHVSTRDLSAILGVSLAIAQGKLTGDRPVSLADISRFPPRFRTELLMEFGAWCSANDNNVSHS